MVRLPPRVANYITQPLPRRTTPAVDAGRDRLASQEEPDIDQLVPRVERTMWAYTICKERFDAVRETLGKYLQKDTTSTPPSR